MPRRPNTSRATQPKTAHQRAFDLREACRVWCPKALEVVTKCLSDKDAKIRLLAAEILFERSYGKAVQSLEVDARHQFVISCPETLDERTWIETKGQGSLLAPQPADAPTRANARTLDLEAEPDKKLN
jgi:hypothetical protein